ncbi:unnamed protein product [Heterobilharzia americana]|nr:unnamed protein product [Heterobilharzia americana]
MSELTPLNVSEGEEIYLTATIKGNPQPKDVTWKHNGDILQPDSTDAVIFYTPETGVCELTISEAFPEDSGIYSVEAQNDLGMAISQTEVVVLVEVRTDTTVLKSGDRTAFTVEAALTIVTDVSDVEEVVATVESLEGQKQDAFTNVVKTEKIEMYSPIETLPEVAQAAVYEHVAEETEYEIGLEEPLEMDDTEFLLEEGVTPTHAIVLDVLIPHDSLSIDETTVSVEEAGKAPSIPSLTEISLHDVPPTIISDLSVVELTAIETKEQTKVETAFITEEKDQAEMENNILIQQIQTKTIENTKEGETIHQQVVESEDRVTAKAEEVIVQEGKETVSQTMEWLSESVGEMQDSDRPESVCVVEQPIEAAIGVMEMPTKLETMATAVDVAAEEEATVPISVVSEGEAEVVSVESKISVTEELGAELEQVTSTVEDLLPHVEPVASSTYERVDSEAVSLEETVSYVSPFGEVKMETELVGVEAGADVAVSSVMPSLSDVVSVEETASEVVESEDRVTAKAEEVIVQEGKETVSQTMEWLSESVGEMQDSDRPESVCVVEQPIEAAIGVMEMPTKLETMATAVDVAAEEEATVPISVVSEGEAEVVSVESKISVTEELGAELEQVTSTVEDLLPHVEPVASSTYERVDSEAVSLEETVSYVSPFGEVKMETELVGVEAGADVAVSSVMPSLSDVVSVEETASEQVVESEDRVTAKAEEVIVQEGKETVSQTMEWLSESVEEMQDSDRPESVCVVEQPIEAAIGVMEMPTKLETMATAVDVAAEEEATVPISVVSEGEAEVVSVESKISVTEELGAELEQVTSTVEDLLPHVEPVASSTYERVDSEAVSLEETVSYVSPFGEVKMETELVGVEAGADVAVSSVMPSLSDVVSVEETASEVVESEDRVTAKAEEVIVQEGKETVSQTMEWLSESVEEMQDSDRPESVCVVEQPIEAAIGVMEMPTKLETMATAVDVAAEEEATVPISVVSEGEAEVVSVESKISVTEELGAGWRR